MQNLTFTYLLNKHILPFALVLCIVKNSIYLSVSDICNVGRYKTKTQYLIVNLDSFFDIGHSLFDIRRKVGYLLYIQNIGHSKFDIQILVKYAHTALCLDVMHIQKTVSTYLYLLYVTQEDTNQNAVSAC